MDWLKKNPPNVWLIGAFLFAQLIGEALVNGLVGMVIEGNRGGGIGFCMVLAMQFAAAIHRHHPSVVTWPWMLIVAGCSALLRLLVAVPMFAVLGLEPSPIIVGVAIIAISANFFTTLIGLWMGRRQGAKALSV